MKEARRDRLSGSVDAVIFANEENGYTVLRLKSSEESLITVTGTLPCVAPGEVLSAEGSWSVHPVHGRQFKVERCARVMPNTVSGIYAYLASGIVKGIGPATARRLVEAYGTDALRILEETPEALGNLKGFPSKKAKEVGAAFRRQLSLRRLLECFAENEIRLSYALLLYRQYGDEAMAVLCANPYLLCEEFYGASFAEADRLALRLGFESDCPERIEAAVLFELHFNSGNGHCFLPEEKLAAAVSQLIGISVRQAQEAILRLTEGGETVREDIAGQHAVYLSRLYVAETEIARRLLEMAKLRPSGGADPAARLTQIEGQLGLTLAVQQRLAVTEALRHGVFVLTGGPGTGKTTTIRAILRLFQDMGLKVSMAAPTGRAAKRMQELSGKEASTIHRLLGAGYDPDLNLPVFQHNEDDPLKTDAVILDETSMVDIVLMQALLRALPGGCRLILVGDGDQLPSVGPGNLLRDLLRSEAVPAVRLTQVFRQAQESGIVQSAHLIDEGRLPDLRKNQGDFFFLRRKSGEATRDTVLELCSRRLPQKMGIPPEEIQVLAPSRRNVAGTEELNRALQSALNPPAEDKPEKSFGDFLFRLGDRVMQTRNNYDLIWRKSDGDSGTGIYNGDIGRITAVDPGGQTLTIEFDDRSVLYSFELLGDLEPAFAMTVHKSQGSEYRAVVLAISQCAPTLLSRAVLYTAVTRARSLLIVVGDDSIFSHMVENNRTQKRYSGLKTRLTAGRS